MLDPSDAFIEVWLRPVDALDPRPPVRIGGWPAKLEADEIAEAQAVIDEHDLDG